MDAREAAALALVLALAAAGVAFAAGAFDPLYTTGGYNPTTAPGPGSPPTASSTPTDAYERATVTVLDANGTTLGTVRVAIADTSRKRYTGLSETASLPADRGMLFVYDDPGNHTFVMRGMDFGIDIVYADADGRITRIHHAPEPPEDADGEEFRYPGYGQYVLEVNLNWTTRHGVTEGDRIRIEDYDP